MQLIHKPSDTPAVWGQLLPTDAATLKARLAAMLADVCPHDPRSAGERRSDAMGAIGRGETHLACRCGTPECPAADAPASSSSKVMIHVLADPAALTTAHELIAAENQDHAARLQTARSANTDNAEELSTQLTPRQHPAGEAPPTGPESLASQCKAATGRPNPASLQRDSGLALLPGATVLPIAALAEAIRNGAVMKPLRPPGPDPEPRYRPSAALAAFVRARDLFCRFPGCTVPAEHCDIDHVIPWPCGPTHPSNLNCTCRTHHLLKTFWPGWSDTQTPDGTVTWTTPSGHTYITTPASALWFPDWHTTTGALPPARQSPPAPQPAHHHAHTTTHPCRRHHRPHQRRTPTQCPTTPPRPTPSDRGAGDAGQTSW